MCVEVFTLFIYRGNGCTRKCDEMKVEAICCPLRPSMIRSCPNYQRIDAGSTTKRTGRPGHDHSLEGEKKKKDGSGGGGNLGGATEGGSAIAA